MSHQGRTPSRGHLRLASPPAPPPPATPRVLLLLRAFAATLQLYLLNLIGFAAVVLALAPVLWRRSPLGSRLAPAPRQARVIQLPPRRRAAPH